MNEKIPVGQIARLLSQQAGVSLASAELFIKAFFDVAVQTLTSGERLKIKEETKATIRCIPFDGDPTPGVCMVTGRPSERRVLFARNY